MPYYHKPSNLLTPKDYLGSNLTGTSGSINRTLNTGMRNISLVLVEREILHPTDDYTISSSTITFIVPIFDAMNITIFG